MWRNWNLFIFIVWLEVTTFCYGKMPQHFRDHIETTRGQRVSPFAVHCCHSFWYYKTEVFIIVCFDKWIDWWRRTATILAEVTTYDCGGGHNIWLWQKTTTFQRSHKDYSRPEGITACWVLWPQLTVFQITGLKYVIALLWVVTALMPRRRAALLLLLLLLLLLPPPLLLLLLSAMYETHSRNIEP